MRPVYFICPIIRKLLTSAGYLLRKFRQHQLSEDEELYELIHRYLYSLARKYKQGWHPGRQIIFDNHYITHDRYLLSKGTLVGSKASQRLSNVNRANNYISYIATTSQEEIRYGFVKNFIRIKSDIRRIGVYHYDEFGKPILTLPNLNPAQSPHEHYLAIIHPWKVQKMQEPRNDIQWDFPESVQLTRKIKELDSRCRIFQSEDPNPMIIDARTIQGLVGRLKTNGKDWIISPSRHQINNPVDLSAID